MGEKDYYKILCVSESANAGEIKKAYRNLAFRYHPDRNPGSEELMKELNEAYAVLSDPSKRNQYDILRQTYGSSARDQFRRTYTDQDIFRDSDIEQIFRELSKAFGFSRPEDIFSRGNFYGQHYRTFEFKGQGGHGRGFFFYGPMGKVISLAQKMIAKRLGIELPVNGRDLHDVIRVSPQEASAGGKAPYLFKLRGAPRELLVTLPQGIRDGQKLKLRGLGEEGKHGGAPGDLYLKVKIRTSLLEKMKSLLKR